MTSAQKDNIYIDVDDEITSIVEKVQKSSSKIVALVLPKRAVVLQSIVNMKLLKRAADEAGKRVVLITSEAGLLPLAGAVGVYTAKNLQSKPEIPAAPDTPADEDELLEAEEAADEDPELDSEAAVGDLAEDDTDKVFESDAPAAVAATASVAAVKKAKKEKAPKPPKAKKDKKSKVPNFDLFRKKVFIGVGAALALLVLMYFALFVAPKATVAITTETSTVNSSVEFTASPTATAVDVEKSIIPAKVVEEEKTDSQKAAATGQKDLGTKATGSVTLSIPCSSVSGAPPTIPVGTGVSANGLTFATQSNAALTTPSFSGGCKFVGTTNVVAQSNGDQYNVSAGRTFSVAGYSSVTGTNGDAFSGGSSKIAKVVSQQDVDNAKQKITDDSQTIKNDLQKKLEQDNYYAVLDSFTTKSEEVTTSPKVDQEGNEVTVTVKKVYTMVGVKREDLRALIDNDVKDEVESRKQQVQDDGINQATFRVGKRSEDGTQILTMQTQVVLGPKIDSDQLKKDIAGKKRGDAENLIKEINGVKDVEVNYSPFWVSKTPKNPNKITIEYKEGN